MGPILESLFLPETNMFAPKNGWLECYFFLLGRPIFSGENVSFREGIYLHIPGIAEIGSKEHVAEIPNTFAPLAQMKA